MNRARVALLAVLVLAPAVTGCLADTEKRRSPPDLVLGATAAVGTLEPADVEDGFTRELLGHVFQGLVSLSPSGLTPRPALAASWNVSEDGRTYTFHLRENATFHDGAPVTAEAVKHTLDRNRGAIDGRRGRAAAHLDVVEAVHATGPRTVEVRLKAPHAGFLATLATQPVAAPVSPDAYPVDAFRNGEGETNLPVAAGPYRVTEYVPEALLRLEAHPDYWGAPPRASVVHVLFYDSTEDLMAAVDEGTVDAALGPFTGADVAALRDAELTAPWRVHAGPATGVRLLGMNVGHPPFHDPHVRRAVAHAVDRPRLVKDHMAGEATPLYDVVPPQLPGGEGDHRRYGDGDGEAARRELAQAGWSEHSPLQVTLWYASDHYGHREDELARAVAAQLNATGAMKVEVRSSQWLKFADDLARGRLGLFLIGWTPDSPDPDAYAHALLEGSETALVGTFYNDTRVDAWLEAARAAQDREARGALYENATARAAQAAPYVPLWQAHRHVVVQRGVDGARLDDAGRLHLPRLAAGR